MRHCPKFSRPLVIVLLLLSGSLVESATGQEGALPNGPKESALQHVSRAQFADHVQRLQTIVRACKATANACGADVGDDEEVSAQGRSAAFTMHWSWLQDALDAGAKAKTEERSSTMTIADEHLSELKAQADPQAPLPSTGDDARARKKMEEVLARPEFRPAAAAQPSWLDQRTARFWMRVSQVLEGARNLARGAPWLGRLLEWGFFVLAGVGLLLFIRRNFVRQRLQIAMSMGGDRFSAWDREANDWASEADACAARHAWRDAVHCLYWAAIVRLEGKRAWRHNPARTPREYVRLLQPGSSHQKALRRLTGIFERVWYGLRDAEAHDYEHAKSLFGELSEGTPASAGAAR